MRKRWLPWLGVLLVAALALVRLTYLPGARQIPHTDVSPYGANFFLDREVEDWKQERTLEMAQAAGIGWIKQQFSWEEIEPVHKGEFEWAKYDRIVDLAERYGMNLIARLDRPPDWTRQDNRFKTRPPDDFEDYGDFVYEVVRRYRGRVRYVQIWNEPNLSAEWGFQR
ncbi:MAG: beta-galactosidase, partial [Anaerolineae bacterium]